MSTAERSQSKRKVAESASASSARKSKKAALSSPSSCILVRKQSAPSSKSTQSHGLTSNTYYDHDTSPTKAREIFSKDISDDSSSSSGMKGTIVQDDQSLLRVCGRMLEGFAGTGVGGSFFAGPASLNLTRTPGTEPIKPELSPLVMAWKYANLSFFFFSPNLLWFVIAYGIWTVAPYDLVLAKDDPLNFLLGRSFVNVSLVLSFFGFWHVALYWLGWATRPFNPERTYAFSKVFHNVFYSVLGALQWTCWEGAFAYCYATGRLPYFDGDPLVAMFNNQVARANGEDWTRIAKFVAWFFIVPAIRDLHFYFTHRFLHNKFLYKYVHSLHHRNTDIEPFSGLSMHPVEHLYYFTCYGPLLYFGAHCSPFAVLWMGVHVLISPAASHSGWEDHFQGDLFHYLHHRYFVRKF